MKEKEARVEQLKGELSDITSHFEENWKVIQEKDRVIKSLKAELQGILGEQERSNSQAGNHGDSFAQWSVRLTELEDRDALICSNLHDLRNQVNKIQFETNKMKENPPSEVRLAIEDEVDRLTAEREASKERINEVRKLTDMIHDEGTKEMQAVETDLETEKQQKLQELQMMLQKKDALIQSIHNVEEELSQCVTHLNNECQTIRMSMVPSDSEMDEIQKLETEHKALQKEVQDLEDAIVRNRKSEVEKQDMIKAIEKRLAERQETNEHEMQEVDVLMKKEEQALSHMRAKLDAQLTKNEQAEEAFQKQQNKLKDGVDVEETVDRLKNELEDEFVVKTKDEMMRKAAAKKELKEKVESIKRINASFGPITLQIQKMNEEIKKRAVYAKKKDKKSKAIAVVIGELEGEFDALQQINEREKSPEAIAAAENKEKQRQLAEAQYIAYLKKEYQRIKDLDQRNREEMHRLETESSLLSDHKIELEKQNHALIKYLIPYEKIRNYYMTHRSLWHKPKLKPAKPAPATAAPPSSAPARVLLECGNVSIQAS